MRTTNKIGIFLAGIIVVAGCQMENEEALHSVAASPTPTLDFIELSSNSVSGSIGITEASDIPQDFMELTD